jgi:hypothetical protein
VTGKLVEERPVVDPSQASDFVSAGGDEHLAIRAEGDDRDAAAPWAKSRVADRS